MLADMIPADVMHDMLEDLSKATGIIVCNIDPDTGQILMSIWQVSQDYSDVTATIGKLYGEPQGSMVAPFEETMAAGLPLMFSPNIHGDFKLTPCPEHPDEYGDH